MSFGQNLYDWLSSQAQPLVWIAIIIIALVLGFKREFTKLLGFLVIAVIISVLVFNTAGVTDVFTSLGNKIIGAG